MPSHAPGYLLPPLSGLIEQSLITHCSTPHRCLAAQLDLFGGAADEDVEVAGVEAPPLRVRVVVGEGAAVELPPGTKTLTLPNDERLRVLAVTVSDEGKQVHPARPLYDTLNGNDK